MDFVEASIHSFSTFPSSTFGGFVLVDTCWLRYSAVALWYKYKMPPKGSPDYKQLAPMFSDSWEEDGASWQKGNTGHQA